VEGVGRGTKETGEMGWSEKYWEDVKSELEQAVAEAEPASADTVLDQPTPVKPVETPERD
jgi:hypothetical protein